jgi:hypothetical protein
MVSRIDLLGDRADVSQVWAPLRDWLLEPVERIDPWRPVLGFACGLNLRSEGQAGHPQPPDELPTLPLFNLAIFRDFERLQDGPPGSTPVEHGVEWWYRPDADWMAMTQLEAWDTGHPIGYHFWGLGDTDAPRFVAEVEQTPMFQLAATKRAILVRVFGVVDDPVGVVLRHVEPDED